MSNPWYHEPPQEKKRRNPLTVFVIILILTNIGIVAYYTLFPGITGENNIEIQSLKTELDALQFKINTLQDMIDNLETDPVLNIEENTTEKILFPLIYKLTRSSVVLIQTRTQTGGGQGSGFIYDKNGHIITNNHVVEGARSITVTFTDGNIVDAAIIGTDPYSDLAVIKANLDEEELHPINLGDSSNLVVGEQVVAIGAPFGLDTTMTAGIVSATARQMDAPGGYAIVDVIQTDAAINPGNSGGPLLNMLAEVIGMNTAIVGETRQSSGIGFAIPSDTIKREITDLIEKGNYNHPWLGITGYELTPGMAEEMNLDTDTRGALVASVVEGGPSENAGLQGGGRQVNLDGVQITVGGDIIIGIDNNPINSFYDLIFYIERYNKPNDVVILTVIRDNELITISLILGTRPVP